MNDARGGPGYHESCGILVFRNPFTPNVLFCCRPFSFRGTIETVDEVVICEHTTEMAYGDYVLVSVLDIVCAS